MICRPSKSTGTPASSRHIISTPRHLWQIRTVCVRRRPRFKSISLQRRCCQSSVIQHRVPLTFSTQKCIIPAPTKTLIHRLAEVGYLYVRVDSFVRDRESGSGIGMIEQSLCHHLQSQLTEYYRLIAVLESQMSNADDTSSDGGPDNIDLRTRETGLTLKRLDVWIQEWRLRMRMMSVCVEGARGM